MLAMPPTLAPAHVDAGRRGLPSRFIHQSYGCGYIVRASLQSVTAPLDLLGYCRCDGRSGRVTTPDNHRDFQVAPTRKTTTLARGIAAS